MIPYLCLWYYEVFDPFLEDYTVQCYKGGQKEGFKEVKLEKGFKPLSLSPSHILWNIMLGADAHHLEVLRGVSDWQSGSCLFTRGVGRTCWGRDSFILMIIKCTVPGKLKCLLSVSPTVAVLYLVSVRYVFACGAVEWMVPLTVGG